MNQRNNRTVLALVLTLVALGVPCTAWYVVGGREAEHQEAALIQQPLRLARDTVAQLTERLQTRLEVLRDNEDKRPFYHYQNLYHDPKGAYEGASVVPSPLAQGPADPLIRAYFQIDTLGRLTLPTLNEDVEQTDPLAELDAQQLQQQCIVQQELQTEAVAIGDNANLIQAATLGRFQVVTNAISVFNSLPIQSAAAPQPKVITNIAPVSLGYSLATADQGAYAPPLQQQAQRFGNRASKTEVLDSSAWNQNASANIVFNSLRNTGNVQVDTAGLKKLAVAKDSIQIDVGPLHWVTIPIRGRPSLVALRNVAAPDGRRIQGILISAEALAQSLVGAAMPVRFESGAASRGSEISAPVGDTNWRIVADAGRAAAEARASAAGIRTHFLRSFYGGVLAVALAGGCIIGLVWQSERLARQRSQFAASAAHELRTPLAGLRLYGDMLAEGLGDPSKSRDYARRLADEAERLGRVVGNVLGFTRLERGTLNVQPVTGDLATVVRECVARQQPALEAAGARIDVAIANELPAVKFDRDAVAQVIQNLLDNAEKHTRQAGNRTIHLALDHGRGGVDLAVIDHGPGVPAKARRHLFEPFARHAGHEAPAGLGLGLVMVKALVEAQGATVCYTTNGESGARFVVSFPPSLYSPFT